MKPKLTTKAHPQLRTWWEKNTPFTEEEATRNGFGQGLLERAKQDKTITALTANLGSSTGLKTFKQKYPNRFYDIGVAEQALAGIAAGMASEGLRPVITSFAVFSPGRNWDFIRTQIVMNKHPVLILGSHAGLATGEDGATHQALEDVALMRSLPGITIISPGDANEAKQATKTLLKQKKPAYLRATRTKTPQLIKDKTFTIKKTITLVEGTDIALLNTGTTLQETLGAAKELWEKHKLSASVHHIPTIKPLDETFILQEAQQKKLLVTIEDHNIIGGLGSAVAEVLANNKTKATLLRIGVNDQFGQTGTKEELYALYGLDAKGITKKVVQKIKQK